MMSEIGFLDPTAQANNESGDVPVPRPGSSFLHKSSAFPLSFGFRKLAARPSVLSFPTYIGRAAWSTGEEGFPGIRFPGQCLSHTPQFQVHSSLSDSLSPLYVFKSVQI